MSFSYHQTDFGIVSPQNDLAVRRRLVDASTIRHPLGCIAPRDRAMNVVGCQIEFEVSVR
jgi:hypothetical protein